MKILQIQNKNNDIILNCNYITHIKSVKDTDNPHITIDFIAKSFEYKTITIDLSDIETLEDLTDNLISFMSSDLQAHKIILNHKE